jgi:2-polyprenyl-6-methoxyphenol hydroxylase-like FAD-dependent oxidoreductase
MRVDDSKEPSVVGDVIVADVIVVGAGPTGLMLAEELALAGVRPVVLEKLTARSRQSKALALQPRSAEVLDLRGLIEAVRGRALGDIPGGHFAGLPVPLDYRPFGSRFPQLGIPQARVEEVLEHRLAGYDVSILRGRELVGLSQDATGVTATVDAGGGEMRLRGEFLVGCDGGRSNVRKLADIGFPGHAATMSAVVADITFVRPPAGYAGEWNSIIGERLRSELQPREKGLCLLLPLGEGVFRILFAMATQQAAGRDEPVTADEVSQAVSEFYGPEPIVGEVRWASRFTNASRQADRYRAGRVLLAGDAAHVHSPVGGQGLNLGLQDAFNLGWKLAAEVAGWAPDGLLDSYHTERHPVGARVLQNTRAQGVLMSPGEDVAALREIFSELLALPETNRHLAGMISGLDIRYGMPGAVPHPLLGSRMPDVVLQAPEGPTRAAELMRSGRGLLLDFCDRQEFSGTGRRWEDRVNHVPVSCSELAGMQGMLIRPDGYVCWVEAELGAGEASPPAGTGQQDLVSALQHWFGAPLAA